VQRGEDGGLVLQGGRDAIPELIGGGRRNVAGGISEEGGDFPVGGELGSTPRTGGQMLVDELSLVVLEGVEGVNAEQLF
jgi:hypothetical protein